MPRCMPASGSCRGEPQSSARGARRGPQRLREGGLFWSVCVCVCASFWSSRRRAGGGAGGAGAARATVPAGSGLRAGRTMLMCERGESGGVGDGHTPRAGGRLGWRSSSRVCRKAGGGDGDGDSVRGRGRSVSTIDILAAGGPSSWRTGAVSHGPHQTRNGVTRTSSSERSSYGPVRLATARAGVCDASLSSSHTLPLPHEGIERFPCDPSAPRVRKQPSSSWGRAAPRRAARGPIRVATMVRPRRRSRSRRTAPRRRTSRHSRCAAARGTTVARSPGSRLVSVGALECRENGDPGAVGAGDGLLPAARRARWHGCGAKWGRRCGSGPTYARACLVELFTRVFRRSLGARASPSPPRQHLPPPSGCRRAAAAPPGTTHVEHTPTRAHRRARSDPHALYPPARASQAARSRPRTSKKETPVRPARAPSSRSARRSSAAARAHHARRRDRLGHGREFGHRPGGGAGTRPARLDSRRHGASGP